MRHSIRIAPKFLLLIVVLVPAMVGIAWIGLQGLSAMGQKVNAIAGDDLNIAEKTAQLGRDISHAGELTLQSIIITAPAEQGRIDAQLIDEANPAVEGDIATLQRLDAEDRAALSYLRDLVSRWHAFLLLEHSGRFEYNGANVQRVNEQTAASVRPLFAAMEQETAALIGKEVSDAAASKASASSTQSHYRGLTIWISVAALGAMLALVLWLIRDVVPRVTAYSAFARRVADDGLVGRIEARGFR